MHKNVRIEILAEPALVLFSTLELYLYILARLEIKHVFKKT